MRSAPRDWRRIVADRARRDAADLPAETLDELAVHLEDVYGAALIGGASPAEARTRALAVLDESAFAPLSRHARRAARAPHLANANDTARAAGRGRFAMGYALRMVFRQIRHHPAFTLATVMVLGLGTGAAAAVYTVVDSVVLRPLPYDAPDRLVTIWDTNAEKAMAHEPVSPVNFMDYRGLPVFTDAAAWWRPDVNLVDPGLDPIRVKAVETSANLFTVLGVRPEIGQGFPADGPFFSRDKIAVISDHLWRTRYRADPSLIGRELQFSGNPYTIVGVMPKGFSFPDEVDVWERLQWDLHQHSRAAHFMETVARLAPGESLQTASTAASTLALRLQHDFAATNKGWDVRLTPLLEDQLGYYRPALMVLFGAVGLLLLISCLNVASLLLTRALSREREMAVRAALGASPRQLVGQLLAESLVLSAGGAIAGLLAAAMAIPLVVSLTPVHIPRLDEAVINGRVLSAALLVVGMTTMFFGLVPGLVVLRRQFLSGLRSGDRGSSRGARRLYHLLVAAEVALACTLLVSSMLLVRTVQRMTDVSLGFKADDALTAGVQLSGTAYASWQVTADTHERIVERLREQPGVVAAGSGNFLPLDAGWRVPFQVQGQAPPARPEDAPQAQVQSVTDGYFEALGATRVAGRYFTTRDTSATTGVLVVNDAFARRYLPGGAVGVRLQRMPNNIGPLGKNLLETRTPQEMHTLPSPLFEIVGVVADVRDAPLSQPIEPAIYFSAQQFPFASMSLVVRAKTPAAAVDAVKATMREMAPTVPLAAVRTWGEFFQAKTAEPRLLMTVLVLFGALAGVLAAIGVYGLLSWSVALRRRELSIRLTLGAQPSTIGALVVRHSLLLVGSGMAVGYVIVRAADHLLARVLFDVAPADLRSTAFAFGLLVAASAVACLPAVIRAMRVDPVEGLRAE